jgi:ActR/RegA family two-component response regulator
MDGIDVLRALRSAGSLIPVVMVTGVGDEELAVRALRVGAADYVPKSGDYLDSLNPRSLSVVTAAFVEPALAAAAPGTRVQFERIGYFCADTDSTPERPVWNRTVTLRDSWAKIASKKPVG